MPFNQNATFQPGLILQGQLDAAQQVADALREQKKMQIEGAYTDAIMAHAEKMGRVSPEEMTKYQASGHRQKIGMANGIAANMMDEFKRQQEKQQNDLRLAQIRHLNSESKDSPYAQTPIWADDGTGQQTQVGIYDQKGSPHYFPYGHAGGGRIPAALAQWDADVAAKQSAKESAYAADPQGWADKTKYNTPTTGGRALDDALAKSQASRDAAYSAYGLHPPVAAPSAQAAVPATVQAQTDSPDAVAADFQSKKITREQAAARLKALGFTE